MSANQNRKRKLESTEDALEVIYESVFPEKDEIAVMQLTAGSELIGTEIHAFKPEMRPETVLSEAKSNNAAAVIIAYGRMTDNPNPTDAEQTIVEGIAEAGNSIGIRVRDCIIIGYKAYYSFSEENRMPFHKESEERRPKCNSYAPSAIG